MAGRVRLEEEADMIKQVLEKRLKRKVNKKNLFSLGPNTSSTTKALLEQMSSIKGFEHVVWTQDMRRLYILVSKALSFGEPVLLVGETGCGKTTVCQMLATQEQQTLYTINCHMHTEGTDLLGGLRPVRTRKSEEDDRLFEWVDGPLILSMRSGGMFLADEISLADDSVLERLNSVLEPERTLLLAEKGTDEGGDSNPEIIVAHDQFRLIGTMNPGGDYGKKELSPALRNRFTEIWCPKVEIGRDASDVTSIINHNLQKGVEMETGDTKSLGGAMLQFLEHFTSTELGKKCTLSIRDLLSWVLFINKVTSDPISLEPGVAYIHGACLVLLDGLGSGHTGSGTTVWQDLKRVSLKFLTSQVEKMMGKPLRNTLLCEEEVQNVIFVSDDKEFGIKPFLIPKGPATDSECKMFTFKAPRTCINLVRLLRGLQLDRPVLLEGSPGVGKTSLVIAMAKAAGHNIVRINLSEQTDVSDLFGADLPVEGGEGGRFAWRDGPFLQALRSGAWIVIDELNLASQSVLEGLNACFDHRGEVFIPELGCTFTIEHKTTKIFACQNPQYQGGARKGLPRSFLNRFTQVYIEPLSAVDLEFIISMMHQELPQEIVMRMVAFNNALTSEILEQNLWGQLGGPWELNLRDMFRWCEIMLKYQKPEEYNPGEYVMLVYSDRMRTVEDKERVIALYDQVFGPEYPGYISSCRFHVGNSVVQAGHAFIPRQVDGDEGCDSRSSSSLCLLQHQVPALESLITCINMKWMAILVGEGGVGKTSVVKFLSRLTGRRLRVVTVNSDMDVTELLGGFEQVDHGRVLGEVVTACGRLLRRGLRRSLLEASAEAGTPTPAVLLQAWQDLQSARRQGTGSRTSKEETAHFLHTCRLLRRVLDFLQQQHQAPTTPSAELDKGKLRKTPKKTKPGEEEEAEVQDLEETNAKKKQKKKKKKMSLEEGGISPLPKKPRRGSSASEAGGRKEAEHDVEEQPGGEQDEVRELRRKVKELEGRVKRSGLVTGGGTFVWVDSILVKSLLEGCWLLLDGVNACSASVLDRLNGLLEPGGTLAMQERGAVGDAVPTLKPHPDFRLILALDPRHGEISRAMRNRGLEIFMPGSRWESPQDLRDVMLLRGAVGASGGLGGGAGNPLAHHALLEAHNAVAQLVPSYQQPGIADLSLAASVSAQLLSAGSDLQDALSDALHLVYVRSRGRKAEQEALTEAVKAAVSSSVSAFPADMTWPPYQELTLSSAAVSVRGSRVVGVRRATYLLHTLLLAAAKPDHASLWSTSPLPPSCQVPDPGVALVPALVHTLAFTSIGDWRLVRQWCTHLLRITSGVPKALREILKKSLQQATGVEWIAPARSLEETLGEGVCGVDPRHNAQAAVALLGSDPEELQNLSSLANKVLLWLRRIVAVVQLEEKEEVVVVPQDKKASADTLSLLQVSNKIEKKVLGSDAAAHPSVVHLAPLLTQVDDLLEALVRDTRIRLTDEEWLRVVLALKWRDRLQSFCSRTVKKAAFHMFLPQLALHWQWLYEELLQKVPDTWRAILPEKLTKTVARLQDVFSAHCGAVHKTAASLRSSVGHPAPFVDAKTAQAYIRAKNMDRVLKPAITAHALNRFLASDDAVEAQGKLLQVLCMEWDPVREEADLHEQFVNLEEFLTYHGVRAPISVGARPLPCPDEDDDEDDDDKENLDLKVQLWPLLDYMACLQHAWGRILALDGKTAAVERALEVSRTSPSVSMTHLALYRRDKGEEVPLYWRRVKSQIATHTYNLLSNSTATRRPSSWRTYSSAPEDDNNEGAVEEVGEDSIHSLGSCLLSHILTYGTKYSTGEIEDVAVAQHVEKARQLEEVRATLWSNWKELTSPSDSYEEAFADYVVAYTTDFISSLASALCVTPEQNIGLYSLPTVVYLTKGIREACDRLPKEAVGLLEGINEVCRSLEETDDLEEKVAYAARLAVLAGGLQASILSHMEAVDPAQRRQLLLGYRKEEVQELEAEMCVYAWLEAVRGGRLEKVPPRLIHPHVDLLKKARVATLAEVEVLSQEVAHRPEPPEYDSLRRDVAHFAANVFNVEKLMTLKEEMDDAHGSRQPPSGLLTRINGFLLSCDNFVTQTSEKYPLYCDLVYPLLQAVCVTCEGLRLLKAKLVLRQVEQRCEGVSSRGISETMSLFAAFPIPREALCPTKVIKVQMASLKRITSMLSTEEETGLGKLCHGLGIRSVLIDTYNAAITHGCLTTPLRHLLESVLSALAHAWRQQEEERKRKEEEEESLYKFKPRTLAGTETEAEEEEREFKEAFPSFEGQFDDLEGPDLNAGPTKAEDPKRDTAEEFCTLTPELLAEVSQVQKLLYTSLVETRWRRPQPSLPSTQTLTPFLLRYRVFGTLLTSLGPVFGSSVDRETVGAHVLFNHATCASLKEMPTTALVPRPYDIYRDANSQEALKMRPLLDTMKERVDELLAQWPSHPTLLLVNKVIARILAFPITSPLMKLVVGLETLLGKAQEWERNAHSGVSLMEHLEAITHLVIAWRKLELQAWRHCLDTVTAKVKTRALVQWWGHTRSLVEAAANPQQEEEEEIGKTQFDSKILLDTLKQFMESGVMGDFKTRLDLLEALHCQAALLPPSGSRDVLIAYSWNLLQYYGQFEEYVNNTVSKARKPIEKQVKNYVKIARWNDINFYAVQESVTKSHRTLHKHMRAWEKVLRQPVATLLRDTTANKDVSEGQAHLGEWDLKPRQGVRIMKCSPLYGPVQNLTGSSEGSVLSRLGVLSARSNKYITRALANFPYPGHLESVEDLTEDIISTYQRLQEEASLAENAGSQEKRLKMLKSVVKRRRDGLSDLFRALAEMGVSYTKGNSAWREDDFDKAFGLPPFDVAVAHEGQSSLKEAWTDCNKYFYRSVARYALLRTSLQQPSRELGPEVIKKLTGISRHFLLVATKQRAELASFSDKTRSLRQLLSSLDSSVPTRHSRSSSASLARDLHSLCSSLTLTLNEILLLMDARPETSPLVTVSGESSGPDALAVSEVKGSIRSILPELRQVISVLNRQFVSRAEDEDALPQMMTLRAAEDLTISFDVVKNVALQVSSITSKLSPQKENGSLCGVQILLQWQKEWREVSEGFSHWQTETSAPSDKGGSSSVVVETLEDCVTRALLGVEGVYKRHCSGRGNTHEEEEEQVKALLTGATIGSLSSDFKALRLNEVLRQLAMAMKTMQEREEENDPELFTACTPLLRQYSDLCLAVLHLQVASHRSLTKMLSVLLVIFENLALKGFCTPQELQDNQDGEGGANSFEDAEGTGLGEGEGKKDKSDQLESEDQLESALQEGESEKAGDQDLKEDDGVEMSEDFEGKMQDLDRREENEDDDDEDKDEDEDLDKQMGETEKGADKLDEKMWGDENEEEGDDEEKEELDEEEGPGDGERTESQMVAKDDNKDQREGNKDKKEELEEMEDTREINEMQEEGEDYGDDFKDPYGGNPEGDEDEDEEQMQLPDDMALDEDEGKDHEEDQGQDDPMEIEEKGLFPEEEREKKEKEEREKPEEEEQKGQEESTEKKNEEGEKEEEEDEESEETRKDDKKQGMEEGNEEEKAEEEEEEEKKAEEEEDKAEASKDKKSEEPVEAAEMDTNEASKDQTKEDTETQTAGQQEEDPEEKQDEQGEVGEKTEDVEGVGQSEAKTRDEAHEGTTSKLITTTDEAKDEDVQDEEKPRKPGRPDEQRVLGQTKEEVHRGLMTKDRRRDQKKNDDEEEKEEDKEKEIDKIEEPEAQERDADEYEHVAHAEDQFDKHMVDTATQEQAEEEPAPLEEQKEDEDEEQQGQMDEPMEVDNDSQDLEDEKAVRQEQPEGEAGQDTKEKRRKQDKTGRRQDAQQDAETKVETEGEAILEATVQRGPDTNYHTLSLEEDGVSEDDLTWGFLEERQREMSDTVMQWRGSRSDAEGAARWAQHESRVSSLANHLCEQLRLILEPTQASKLKGDFRTGKRLNMRKVIPYIASEFRKDKIWLRRTQPNKRTYQILLAVDDSESMAEVKAQTLAYESVALVTKALTLLEAGQVGVVSFGSKTQVLHPLHEPFGEESGASVLTNLTFEQKETNFARMLEDSVALLLNSRAQQGHTVGNPDLAQLLLIISDGQTHARSKAVRAAVKAARENRIFVVFVVLDAMDNEYSFYDVLVWEEGAMTPLVQTFPFPFFLVVRDVTTLPDALATALRQWFELVTADAH